MSNSLKGACIIGQSGGPTAVINASAYGVIKTALDCPQITRVLGAKNGIRGVLDDRLYDMGLEEDGEIGLVTPASALAPATALRHAALTVDAPFHGILVLRRANAAPSTKHTSTTHSAFALPLRVLQSRLGRSSTAVDQRNLFRVPQH